MRALTPFLVLAALLLSLTHAQEDSASVAPIKAALQRGEFAKAAELAEPVATGGSDRADEARYLQAVALQLMDKHPEAIAAADALISKHPKSKWLDKGRFLKASSLVKLRRFQDAEPIYAAAAEALVSPDRKGQIARALVDFADALAADPGLNDPNPSPPDYAKAYDLYKKVLEMEIDRGLQDGVTYKAADVMRRAGNHAKAIEEFHAYLQEFDPAWMGPVGSPQRMRGQKRQTPPAAGSHVFDARDGLGLSQLASNQFPVARVNFEDLLALLEATKPIHDAARLDLNRRIADTRWRIVRSHHMPQAEGGLERAITAGRDFLLRHPDHPHAVEAAWLIPQTYQTHGRFDQAAAAYEEFINAKAYKLPPGEAANAKLDGLNMSPAELRDGWQRQALFQIGAIRFQQKKYDGAIAAWTTYITRHPTGPQWADAQRQIIDAHFMIVLDAVAARDYDKARDLTGKFLAANPLDPRAPQLLYVLGQIHYAQAEKLTEGKVGRENVDAAYQRAIAEWEKLASKHPDTEESSLALYRIGLVYEEQLHSLDKALESYRRVTWGSWAPRARQRVAVMTDKQLIVHTERKFHTDETARVTVKTRNVEKLTVKRYSLDLEAYFRKTHSTGGVESLDIALIEPDKTWEVPVEGYARHKPIEQSIEVPFEAGKAGVCLLHIGEEDLEATTLVIRSDIDVVTRSSKRELLVYAQDMRAGRPAAGVRVLASDGRKVFATGATGEDGVFRKTFDELRECDALRIFVEKDRHVAATGLDLSGLELSTGLTRRGLIYTDRPAYQPGQTVYARGIIRTVKDGAYHAPVGAEYVVSVTDASGRAIREERLKLGEFGTFAIRFALDGGAPSGQYTITAHEKDKPETDTGTFTVQPFQLEKMRLAFDFPRRVYFRGEKVTATLRAEYYWGQPVAEKTVRYHLPDGTSYAEKTDEKGELKIEFDAAGMTPGSALPFAAEIEGENVAARDAVWLPLLAFNASVSPSQKLSLSGEPFDVTFTTTTPDGKPYGAPLTLTILRRETVKPDPVLRAVPWVSPPREATAEVTVEEKKIATDDKTGKAVVKLSLDKGGRYTLRVTGEDRFGQTVVAEGAITISGDDDATKLRIFADSDTLKVGQEGRVRLHSRAAGDALALVTFEGETIIGHRVLPIKPGYNDLTVPIDHAHFPNFTLAATVLDGRDLRTAAHQFKVERELRVAVKPLRDVYSPGKEGLVELTVTDQIGRPVRGEFSLAMVNESLYSIFPDTTPDILAFFQNGAQRHAGFIAGATNSFAYHPRTLRVVKAVQDETERLARSKSDAQEAVHVRQALPPFGNGPAFDLSEEANGDRFFKYEMDFGPQGEKAALPLRSVAPASRGMSVGGGETRGEAREPKDAVKQLQAGMSDVRGSSLAKKPALNTEYDSKSLGGLPRVEMPSDGFWLASIVTTPDGKAAIGVPMPQATSRWRLTARGVTGETLVGRGVASVVTRKDFFVELKTPRSLLEGDKVRITARVHNMSEFEGNVDVKLTVRSGEKKFNELRQSVQVGKNATAESLFDEIEVPQVTNLDVTVEARAGDLSDAVTRPVPVRPWGAEYAAHRGGVSFGDTTVVLQLPPDLTYRSKWMALTIGADVRQQVIRMALDNEPVTDPRRCGIEGAVPASDLLAATAGLTYARSVDAPQIDRQALLERVRSLAGALVVTQLKDGGWSWGGSDQSDWQVSAMAYWAIADAGRLGVEIHKPTLAAAENYLHQAFQRIGGSDYDAKAVILHALSVGDKADFQLVNPLHRQRNALSPMALAYTALALTNLDRKPMAREVLTVLETKLAEMRLDDRTAAYLSPQTPYPWLNDRVEASATGLLALMKITPLSNRIPQLADYLLTSRGAQPWRPAKARGPAVAALAEYFRQGQFAQADFTLDVSINDRPLTRIAHDGVQPLSEIAVPADFLKDGANVVRFHLEGHGGFAWAATFRGFSEQFKDPQTLPTPRVFAHRVYHDQLGYRGAPIGVNSTSEVKNLEVGQKTRVWVGLTPVQQRVQPPYLFVEEHLPAGVTLVPGSLRGQFTHHEVRDGALLLYFAPGHPATSYEYEVVGYSPGRYRIAPPIVRDALNPEQMHMGEPGEVVVLPPGQKSDDRYAFNDVERFALGSRYFEDGKYKEALEHLVPLFERQYKYNEREVARMLLWIHTTPGHYDARRVVDSFEVLSERFPDLVVPFDRILAAGKAYHDTGEFERASLVLRATIASSFLRDSAVSAILQDEGRLLASIDYQENLWWRYPDSPEVVSSLFALSQVLYENAAHAHDLEKQKRAIPFHPPGRDPKASPPKPTRAAMLGEAIDLLQRFLTLYPGDPLADDAAFSMTSAYLDLRDYDAVVRLSRSYRQRFVKSDFNSSFQYMTALGHFWKRDYEPALNAARAVADGESKDRDFARYILGQVHHARGNPAEAIGWYQTVADLYPDAREAIDYFRQKRISLEEVNTFLPGKPVELELKYRNIPEARVQVYRVDPMKLYLREKNLSRIAAVNLAGIEPQAVQTLKLGDGKDYVDKTHAIRLDNLRDEGAYLVIARGDDLFASGLVLITPLRLEVQEEAASGRVRVNVLDQIKGLRPAGVHVKAIGSRQSEFRSGDTDLRGIFIADDVHGNTTVIARDDSSRYAFFRGKTWLGSPPVPPVLSPAEAPHAPGAPPALNASESGVDYQQNLRQMNETIQGSNSLRWDQLRRSGGKGVQIQQAK